MKIKLLLLLVILTAVPALAQRTGVQGTVVDAATGQPVKGATVILDKAGVSVITGAQGDFVISNAQAGTDELAVVAYGYEDFTRDVEIFANVVDNLGKISLQSDAVSAAVSAASDNSVREDYAITEAQLEDEEGNAQTISALNGTSDNVYYKSASYDFSAMRFRMRGYDSEYTKTSINGVVFNDPDRGRFNYSMLGGMNQAFRNKSIAYGLEGSSHGFGLVGGTNEISTYAKDFAPGIRASVAATNSSYYLRGMFTYASGLNDKGWAFAASLVGRYSDEGYIPGTFYNSWGYFLAIEKVINPQHSISLTTFGAPTKRGGSTWAYEETVNLTGDYNYNANWGYQEGKKRNSRVVDSFDPSVILNWVFTPSSNTKLNTGVAYRSSKYASSALNRINAASDPNPQYYRYLPSWYSETPEVAELYTYLWQNDTRVSQVNWDNLYNINYLNNVLADQSGVSRGSTYILENRHSNQNNLMFNSTLNTRLNDVMRLQAGVGLNYTKSSYYKTVKDLLGGRYWLDVDPFAERDFPGDMSTLQNDMDNPDRKVGKGDRFGYDYDINTIKANAWIQNTINTAHWDVNYGLEMSYTQYQRNGHMRNGRAPENSKGKGEMHRFDNAAIKVGATYKLDGRNSFTVHAYYGSQAPLANSAYVSPRIKDDVISNLKSERVLSGDISYNWNYRRFRGNITGYWTNLYDHTERLSYYDDQYSAFMNYAITGVSKTYKGIEVGMAFKLTPSVTLSAAGTFARYQYKNRPTGTRSYENGAAADTTQILYLKNFYVGGTPQQAYSVGIDWAAPKNWFLGLNAVYMGDAFVEFSPLRHEAMPKLWTVCQTEEEYQAKIEEVTRQERLTDVFTLNASVGKVFYFKGFSLNLNLSVDNILNKRNIQTGGYQQSRFDYTNYSTVKYPNRYFYGQGTRFYFNMGVRF